MSESFASQMKLRRAELNLSMNRLAELAAVNKATLYRIASGSSSASRKIRERIQNALDLVAERPDLAVRAKDEPEPVFNEPNAFASWVTLTGLSLGFPSSAALARALGIQQSTVSRWKSNDTQPSAEHLAKVSELFGVDLRSLLILAGHLPSVPSQPVKKADLRPRLADDQIAVRAEDVMSALRGPLEDPEAYLAAVKRLHLACLVDAEIVEEDDQ